MTAFSASRSPDRPAEPLVRLAGVGKRFPGEEPVLADLALSLDAGEILALIGPSGCGKSTALRIVAGLETADAGTVERPDGGIGFVFQDATLMPWANALDNVALPLRFARVGRSEARDRAAAALDLVGLAAAAAKTPRELSGGMRMRVAIARALVTRPRLLLMDEPFAALDEIGRFALEDDLLRLRDREGFAVLFVTHSIFEAVHLGDRIAVMAAAPGRVVAEIAVGADTRRTGAFRVTPAFAAVAAEVSGALAAAMGADGDAAIDAVPAGSHDGKERR